LSVHCKKYFFFGEVDDTKKQNNVIYMQRSVQARIKKINK